MKCKYSKCFEMTKHGYRSRDSNIQLIYLMP